MKPESPTIQRPVRRQRSVAPSKPSGKSSSGATIRIRTATAQDVPTILAMIRGLAIYEKLAHEVRASTAQLKRDGFGRKRYFRVLLAEQNRRSIGFALYFFSYSTFLAKPTLYLEDLFVLPKARGTGAGKALLRALARAALKEGCGRMDWLVLANNSPAIDFYRRLGAQLHPLWVPTRLTGDALRRLAQGA